MPARCNRYYQKHSCGLARRFLHYQSTVKRNIIIFSQFDFLDIFQFLGRELVSTKTLKTFRLRNGWLFNDFLEYSGLIIRNIMHVFETARY